MYKSNLKDNWNLILDQMRIAFSRTKMNTPYEEQEDILISWCEAKVEG